MASSDALPRCVVLPLVSRDPAYPHVGLALHFLIGNLVVLHPGFREFWFGWRVSNIFPEKADLSAYSRTGDPAPDPIEAGRREKIRFWIAGTAAAAAQPPAADLSLTDAHSGRVHGSGPLSLDLKGRLIGFRSSFMNWLHHCGRPFPETQRKRALWPEKASAAGLDAVGRALEVFYLQSAYEAKGPVDPAPFEAAADRAPMSFMAQDLLGWAHYRNGRLGPARHAFLRAVEINACGAGAMAGLMWCGVVSGDREDALYWASHKADVCGLAVEPARQKALRLLQKHGG